MQTATDIWGPLGSPDKTGACGRAEFLYIHWHLLRLAQQKEESTIGLTKLLRS